jgi:hypothetical protein
MYRPMTGCVLALPVNAFGTGNSVNTKSIDSSPLTQRWAYALVIGWLAAVLCGLGWLVVYAHTPAGETEPQTTWPANTQIALSNDLPTLVMFAHPRCPCTRASVAELAKIAAKATGRFAAWVVLFKPAGSSETWEQTDLSRSAEEIPGVRLIVDADAKLARKFQATTSGQTLLYSPAGKLLFCGGITTARGHEGDNTGESTIIAILTGKPTDVARTPVFGCPIIEPE